MTLEFIQIIYEDVQAEQCYPFARIHKNETLTPYFENSVIAQLVPEIQSDLIGVCSWRLKQKRGDMFRLSDKALDENKLIINDYDVAVLTPRSPSHKPLSMASHWHGTAWDKAFEVFKRFLKNDLGVRVPHELTNAIYENHFVTKRGIYHDYVANYLNPAIQFISSFGDTSTNVFLEDAGYTKRKTNSERESYCKKTARKDWPIAPFILERLFSIYCEGKNFNIKPL